MRSKEHPRRAAYSPGWQFSALRARWLLTSPTRLAGLLVVGLVVAGVLLASRSRWTGLGAVLLFLILWAMSQTLVAVLGDGFAAIEQHLMAARLSIDFVLALGVWGALSLLVGWFRRKVMRQEAVPEAPSEAGGGREPEPADGLPLPRSAVVC